jgi:hypothetical protein
VALAEASVTFLRLERNGGDGIFGEQGPSIPVCLVDMGQDLYLTQDTSLHLSVFVKLIFIIDFNCDLVPGFDVYSLSHDGESSLAEELAHLVFGDLGVIQSSKELSITKR